MRTSSSVVYLVVTAVLWLVALPVALVLDGERGLQWRGLGLVATAVALAAAGLVLIDRGAGRLSRAGIGLFGIAPGVRLVTDGIYGAVRNPIDIGTCLLSLSVWLALDVASMWLIPAGAIVWIVGGSGPYEDRRLLEVFGDEFDAYRSQVRKWVPQW